MRVFISYSSKDGKDYAKRLYDVLKERGHTPFFDDHDISTGRNIWEGIEKELLNEKSNPLFVITPSSMESKGQKKEYNYSNLSYKEPVTFIEEGVNTEEIFKVYPYLKTTKPQYFSNSTFESQSDELSKQLVKLQDYKDLVKSQETISLIPRKSTQKTNFRAFHSKN